MIPKKDAQDRAELASKEEAKRLEEKIDAQIVQRTRASVDISGISTVAVLSVEKLFRSGGWSVQVIRDQRDQCIIIE